MQTSPEGSGGEPAETSDASMAAPAEAADAGEEAEPQPTPEPEKPGEEKGQAPAQPPQPKLKADDFKNLFKLMMQQLMKPALRMEPKKKDTQDKNEEKEEKVILLAELDKKEKLALENIAKEFNEQIKQQQILSQEQQQNFVNQVLNPALKAMGCESLEQINQHTAQVQQGQNENSLTRQDAVDIKDAMEKTFDTPEFKNSASNNTGLDQDEASNLAEDLSQEAGNIQKSALSGAAGPGDVPDVSQTPSAAPD